MSSGYAELFNAFVICAPLDALNWKRMHASEGGSSGQVGFQNLHLDSWGRVLALNVMAKDEILLKFLRQASSVYSSLEQGTIKEDPFPTGDFLVMSQNTIRYIASQRELPIGEIKDTILEQLAKTMPSIPLR